MYFCEGAIFSVYTHAHTLSHIDSSGCVGGDVGDAAAADDDDDDSNIGPHGLLL